MTNILEVVSPFSLMVEGDRFEKTDRGSYIHTYGGTNESVCKDGSCTNTYTFCYEISEEYAKILKENGCLKEVSDTKRVNVFDEITNLIDLYSNELSTIDKDMKDSPACLKIERQTVLENMIKVLGHLKSLKK